jgi:hypothetical protein
MKRLWIILDDDLTGERVMITGWFMILTTYKFLKYDKHMRFKRLTIE